MYSQSCSAFSVTLAGEGGRHVINLFNDLNEVIMKMIFMIIRIAPLGVFCLLAKVFALQGIDILIPLLGYLITVVIALFTAYVRYVHRVVTCFCGA